MRQTTLRLTEGDYLFLQDFRARGVHSAREINRAHVLVALHQNVSEAAILQVLGIGRSSLWRTRAAYNERGLTYALRDEARPGQPRKYQTDQEAEVVALACSHPPAGRKRWTIALLTDAVRRRPKLRTINRETVRQILKKTHVSLGVD